MVCKSHRDRNEGRRGFQRLMIGSVAEGLVRISTKPVLLIRGT